MVRLDEKVVLITGGESGIGLATARLFVTEGARVHLVGIDEGKLDAAVGELGSERASSAVADVTDEAAVERAIAAGVERHGRFDVLFSNAGISGAVAPIVDYPSDDFARTLLVHILAAVRMRPTWPCFAAVYAEKAGGPMRPVTLDVMMMLPPSGTCGAPCLITWNAPRMCTSSVRAKSSEG